MNQPFFSLPIEQAKCYKPSRSQSSHYVGAIQNLRYLPVASRHRTARFIGTDSDFSVVFYTGIRFVNNGINAHWLSLARD